MGVETFFSNVIHTSLKNKDVKLRPIILKTDIKFALKRIRKVYQDNKFLNIWSKEEYGEIYGEQYPYEITCHLIEDGSNVICHIMVYNTEGKRKKSELLYFKGLLVESLKDIVDNAN